MDTDCYDHIFKIVLIGDAGVGKSNILTRHTINEFNEKSKATIGVEFATKTENVNGHVVKLQIWDTAGQERFRSLTSLYYRGASGVIIVYDITKYITFENVNEWMQQVREQVNINTVITVVGNKLDLEHLREVTCEDIVEFSKKYNIKVFEVSAKTGDNIADIFTYLSIEICKLVTTPDPDIYIPTTNFPNNIKNIIINPQIPSPKQNKSKCC